MEHLFLVLCRPPQREKIKSGSGEVNGKGRGTGKKPRPRGDVKVFCLGFQQQGEGGKKGTRKENGFTQNPAVEK